MFRELIIIDTLSRLGSAARLFDCEAVPWHAAGGRNAFDEGHMPWALHSDFDRDLANAPGERGRHPLPERAAHNVVAMRLAGFDEPALYSGSWSEWTAEPAQPLAP